jgi:hypothetical protein
MDARNASQAITARRENSQASFNARKSRSSGYKPPREFYPEIADAIEAAQRSNDECREAIEHARRILRGDA